MRRAIILAVAAAAVLTVPVPAGAKMEATAFIEGPGLPGGGSGSAGGSIWMDGSDPGGFLLLAVVFRPERWATDRPEGDLGPRYDVRHEISVPEGEPDIVQHLYPYAEAGPVLYTPPGQRLLGSSSGGWHRAPARLIRALENRGLPETWPVRDVPVPPPASTDTGGLPAIAWAVALLTGLLAAAAVGARRRVVARRTV